MRSGLALPEEGGGAAFDEGVGFFMGAFEKRVHEDSEVIFTTKCH
jgi:hypothetical protein